MSWKSATVYLIFIIFTSTGLLRADAAPKDLNITPILSLLLLDEGTSIRLTASGLDDEGKYYYFDQDAISITLSSSSTTRVTYSLTANQQGVSIHDNLITVDGGLLPQTTLVQVEASDGSNKGQLEIILRKLDSIELFNNTTSGGAELLIGRNDLVQVALAEDNHIPSGTNIQVIGAAKDDGLWKIKLLSPDDVSMGSIRLILPTNNELNAVFGTNTEDYSAAALTRISKERLSAKSASQCSDIAEHKWEGYTDWYTGPYRLHDYYYFDHLHEDPLSHFKKFEQKESSRLCGRTPPTSLATGRLPILFIHGYTGGDNLGGGHDTWGGFLKYADDWSFVGRETAVFEFKWKTNAKFEDAAGDLSKAIKLITDLTGENAHIIAHSFGGILARTYLQGMENPPSFHNTVPVASLTTVGTPHSGLGAEGGYDSTLVGQGSKLCGQISCYQMGDDQGDIFLPDVVNTVANLGSITSSLDAYNFKSVKSPSSSAALPVQVLIGRSFDTSQFGGPGGGDGLISFEGQRFKPSDGNVDTDLLRNYVNVNNAVITEELLNQDNYSKYRYFKHSNSLLVEVTNSLFQSHGTPEVYIDSDDHPSVKLAKAWIQRHLTAPTVKKYIKYQIQVLNEQGNPFNNYFVIVNGYNKPTTQLANSKTEFRVAFEPSKPLSIKISPKYGTQLKSKILASFTMPASYPSGGTETLPTVSLRRTSESDASVNPPTISDITRSGSSLSVTIEGNNLHTNIKVFAQKEAVDSTQGTITSQSRNQIIAQFNSLDGVETICVREFSSQNVAIASDCYRVPQVKGTSALSTLIPNNILASKSISQLITIRGSGFTSDMKVHYRNSSQSNIFRTSKYVNSTTMTFWIKTWHDNPTWAIWVEGDKRKSNERILNVDISVNTVCTPNTSKSTSCSIPNGYGIQTASCLSNGNAWSEPSSCDLVGCISGFHPSGSTCLKDVVSGPRPTEKPNSVSPGDPERASSEVLNNTNVSLEWSPVSGAVKYRIELYDFNTNRYLLEDYFINGTSYPVQSLLALGHEYFWSVRACNANHECSSRNRVYFSTSGEIIPPDVPVGLNPGTTIEGSPTQLSGTSQTLSWNSAQNASWYQVTMARGKLDHSAPIILRHVQTNNTSYPLTGLEEGETYYWYVEACNDDACVESVHLTFKILAPVVVNNDVFISNTDLSESTVSAGSDIEVSCRQNYAGNQTNSDLSNPNVGFYLSTDRQLDSSDVYLGNESSSIGSDDPYDPEDEIVTIPGNTSAGLYYILFVADYLDEIDEGSSEDNNVEYKAINIQGSTLSVVPGNSCGSAPSINTNQTYSVTNLDTGAYTKAAPIEGRSRSGNNVRGFWVRFNAATSGNYIILVGNPSSNFDPVFGVKYGSCPPGNYIPNAETGYSYVDANGDGGAELFTAFLSSGSYAIRMYHYDGSESPDVDFSIISLK